MFFTNPIHIVVDTTTTVEQIRDLVLNALMSDFNIVATTLCGDELLMRSSSTVEDDFQKLSIVPAAVTRQYRDYSVQYIPDLEPLYIQVPTQVPTRVPTQVPTKVSKKRTRRNAMVPDEPWTETIGTDTAGKTTYSLHCSDWSRDVVTIRAAGWHYLNVMQNGRSVSRHGQDHPSVRADHILYANQLIPFDWGSFALRHDPGYAQPVVDSICRYVQTLDSSNQTIIVTTGWEEAICATRDTRVRCHSTTDGIRLYNAMVKNGIPTILFLHLTC